MAIAKDGNGTQLKVVYGAPWTGVDTSLPEDTIPDSATPFSDNVYIWRGELRSFPRLKNISTNSPLTYPILNSPDGTRVRKLFNGYFNQIIRTDVPPGTFAAEEPPQMLTGAITDSGVYILRPNWRNGQVLAGAPMYISNPHWQLGADISADNLFNPYSNIEFPAVVSNAILYFSKCGSKIYSFNPSQWSNAAGGVLTVLADWFGCSFMQMINEHLVCVSINESHSPVQPTDGFYQSRVRWSPSGIFNQFDPTVNPAAGFNDLQDVKDIVTGFISLGTTGMIFRTNGITQMYPIGGLNPFGFNNLWASEHGIGSIFINTLDNYGNMCCFISEEDVYVMTPSSFKGITGRAKQAIYSDLLNQRCFDSVMGTLIPGFQDGHAHFVYQIYIPDTVTGTVPVVWTYSFDQDLWFRKVLTKTTGGVTTTYRLTTKPKVLPLGDATVADYISSTSIANIDGGINNTNKKILIPSETSTTSGGGIVITQDLFTFDTNDYAADESITYQFKVEQVEEDTSPTFHRIRVIYRDFGQVSLIFTITGIDDTGVAVIVSNTQVIGTIAADQKIKRAYVDLTFTGKQPQLTITRAIGGAAFSILRVTLLGDVGDIRA